LAERIVFQIDQTEPENQNFLCHFPECRINPNLVCFDNLFADYLVKNQKHHRFRHPGIDQA
jgi:hypothetical protein